MNARAADFDVFHVRKEWCHHEVLQKEVVRIDVKGVASDAGNPLPVTRLHRFAGHHFEQRTGGVEVIDDLTKVFVRLPLLQGSRQLTTPGGKKSPKTSQVFASDGKGKYGFPRALRILPRQRRPSLANDSYLHLPLISTFF